MLIMAKERSGPFLINNIVLIGVQLLVTLSIIKQYGVYAVIAGRAAASCCGQVGNFSIIRWGLPGLRIGPPSEYWLSLIIVVPSALIALSVARLSITYALLLLTSTSIAFLAAVRFRVSEIVALVPHGRKK